MEADRSVAMIETDNALERLADLAGIEVRYRDFAGEERIVPESTVRALLAALEIDASDDAAVERAIATLEEAPWRRAIEPTIVVTQESETWRIPVVVDAGVSEIAWTIVDERGRTTRGREVLSEATIAGEREIDGRRRVRVSVDIGHRLASGYHRITIDGSEATLIVAPSRCFLPPEIDAGDKVWGIAVQLYALRSATDWGIGDFGTLREFATVARRAGANAVGLGPLHERDVAYPDDASPYGPSSRTALDPLAIDVTAVPEVAESLRAQQLAESPELQAWRDANRRRNRVDYAAVAQRKGLVLEAAYATFREAHLAHDDDRARAFARFLDADPRRRKIAIFDTLREYFVADGIQGGWPSWPRAFQDPDGDAVAAFARDHDERVGYHAYLQFVATEQLDAAARVAGRMTIGLYRDLAVGARGDGADAWIAQGLIPRGVTVGAPPDPMNAHGQNWGIAPFSPRALRECGYAPFATLLRENMRGAGALRIDHVMALQRLYWIPAGASSQAGGYVRYPLGDLLAILALESERNACMVIGEDLGTVPEGFRERLQWSRIFSYRLLQFERDSDRYFPPETYPAFALASAGTHDLPTLPAFWRGDDLALRERLALYGPGQSRGAAEDERRRERLMIVDALADAGDLDANCAQRLRDDADTPRDDDGEALVRGAYRFLARTSSRLLIAQLDDILGSRDQINVPGTTTEHANWRVRFPLTVEEIARDARFVAFAAALRDLRSLAAPPRVPTGTYRLQFHRDFTFRDAERIVPYLARLGVSHVYASPFLRARSGSTHGYDIIDHNALNPEIGTREDFDRLVTALRRRGMGIVLDFVPNHMGVGGSENPWWLDVLEWGRNSPYASFFDIEWRPAKRELHGKVLLPFLGDRYGEILARGELQPKLDADGGFSVWYYTHRFPIALRDYADVLGLAATTAPQLAPLAASAREPWTIRSLADRERQRARATALKAKIAAAARDERVRTALDSALAQTDLVGLIGRQAYRPALWRVAFDEINYRRFFDINDLAGLRVEEAECFALIHQLAFKLLEDGQIQGLRIDHIDGLFDPRAYIDLLQQRAALVDQPLYLIVEKILAAHERLPASWNVDGTTGYEFLNIVGGLFVDERGEGRLDRLYRSFTGERLSFDEVLYVSKRRIIAVQLAAELEVLANLLERIAESNVRSSDFTRNVLRIALTETVAAFPVYRTYIDGDGASEDDRRQIDWAIGIARRRSPLIDDSVFSFLREVLTTDLVRAPESGYDRRAVIRFAMKFQQYTAPVMAKSLEDTSFYRYVRLVSLNEVGGDPRRFGTSTSAFHRQMRERAEQYPSALSSSSTHDTKRSEDVRVRISGIAELAAPWRRLLRRLDTMTRRYIREVDGTEAPDANDRYLIAQTLVGAWPLEIRSVEDLAKPELGAFADRMAEYVRKALREAKRRTSWAKPNEAYEEAAIAFVRGLLSDPPQSPVWTLIFPFLDEAIPLGLINAVGQAAVKYTAPGVPDTYQGTELIDLSLVDPDNRRPVDFETRTALLAELNAHEPTPERARRLTETIADGRLKMLVTMALLRDRRRRPDPPENVYLPCDVEGVHAERVVAFVYRDAITVVPRSWTAVSGSAKIPPLGERWGDTTILLPERLAGRTVRSPITGERFRLAHEGPSLRASEVFAHAPVAVLLPEESSEE